MATRRTTGSVRTPEAAPPVDKTAPSRRGSTVKAGEVSAPKGVPGASTGITVSADTRRGMIAHAAYLRAERRGFTPGGEAEDWLAAEAEVDALLKAGHGRPPQ